MRKPGVGFLTLRLKAPPRTSPQLAKKTCLKDGSSNGTFEPWTSNHSDVEQDYSLGGSANCRNNSPLLVSTEVHQSTVCGCAIDAQPRKRAWFKCHRQLRLELYSAAALKRGMVLLGRKQGRGRLLTDLACIKHH
jgi:hypothetical protein